MARITREEIETLRGMILNCFEHGGQYSLSSGRTSNYYYEGKLGTLNPPTVRLIGEVLVEVILDSGAEAVGGLEIGSVPITGAVGLAALERDRLLPGFIVRKQPKEHGTRSRIAESYVAGDDHLLRPGRPVAIVDDVITTGSSIEKAIEAVTELGCNVAVVVALVERHESEGKALRDRGFPVLRVFHTNEDGELFIDDDFVRRTEEAARPRVLSR